MRYFLQISVLVAACWANACQAGQKHKQCEACCQPKPYCPPICWCADDYCRKPMPCVKEPCAPADCGCYCRKPEPCVRCPNVCTYCDDYCRKPCPPLCSPQTPPPAPRCAAKCGDSVR